MKITKSYLKKIILEEIKNQQVEEGKLANLVIATVAGVTSLLGNTASASPKVNGPSISAKQQQQNIIPSKFDEQGYPDTSDIKDKKIQQLVNTSYSRMLGFVNPRGKNFEKEKHQIHKDIRDALIEKGYNINPVSLP